MGKAIEITAAEAIKFFGKRNINVQEAKPAKGKDDNGKPRTGYDTKSAPLAEGHILAARDYGDRVAITTVDGRRHEADKNGRADKQ